jgi:dihydropteroate synthase
VTRKAFFLEMLDHAAAKRGVAVMGICNVTPDSFSDGGRWLREEDARAQVDALMAEGADIVDIGGESTRPGARPVPAAEQLERVLPVVRYAASKVCVSIDTTDPQVAEACLAAGAHAVNDVSCLRDDGLARVTARAEAAFVLMHARGQQTDMAGFSKVPEQSYVDVVREVVAEWASAAARAAGQGVARDALVMDPGLGFMKSARHSAELLRSTAAIAAAVRVPVLVGASRKSFLRLVDEAASPQERAGASIAAAVYAARHGAKMVRVHDVRATRQAIDWWRLLEGEVPRA